MIIPIRCFTCNKVIADKWIPFIEIVNIKKGGKASPNSVPEKSEGQTKDQKKANSEPLPVKKDHTDIKDLDIEYINLKNPNKSVEGEAMDELGLHRYCCRRMFLGNVHLITYI